MKTVVAKIDFEGYTSSQSKRQAFAKGETYQIADAAAENWSEQGWVEVVDEANEEPAEEETTSRGRRGDARGSKRS